MGDGSLGRPRTRSPTMLRWIWLVPPQMVSLRLKKNALDHRAHRIAGTTLVAQRSRPRADGGTDIDEHRRRPEDVERQHHRLVVHLAPEHLVRRPERADSGILGAGQRRRQRSQPVDPQQLDLGVVPAQPIADDRIGECAVGRGLLDQQLVLLLETAVTGRRRLAALERQRRVGDLPTVVDASDHVVLRAARIGEEHLAELRSAVGLGDAANLDTGLAHGHEEVRDALVLGGIRIGTGQQEAVVGVVPTRGPHLLTVDHPLVTVEHGAGRQRRQIGAGVGLAETLAPAHRSVEDAWQELLLLRLGTPLQDGRTDQGVTEEIGPQRGLEPGELLGQDHALHAS